MTASQVCPTEIEADDRPRGTGGIGTMGERSLHAALKGWYTQPGDREEVAVDGYHIDLVRGDLLIEIQTRGFAAMKRKLADLLERHPVRLVHPISREKWLVKLSRDGLREQSRRKSPKRGQLLDLFGELVSLPAMVAHENLSLQVLMIQEEEVRRPAPRSRRRWRRDWTVHDRRLVQVLEVHDLSTQEDFARLLPATLPTDFTTEHLALGMRISRSLAQKIAYCLRHTKVIEAVGKQGNAIVYRMPCRHEGGTEGPSGSSGHPVGR